MTSPATSPLQQTLSPAPGVTPPSREARRHNFLSDALVARGLVSQTTMDAALNAARDGRRYCDILVADGALREDDIARALADHHEVDHVDLDVFAIEPAAKARIPDEIARRNGALAIATLPAGDVVVAIYDPGLTNMVEIADRIGSPIRAVIAARSQIERRLSARWAPPPVPAAPPAAEAPAPAPPVVAVPAAPQSLVPAAPPTVAAPPAPQSLLPAAPPTAQAAVAPMSAQRIVLRSRDHVAASEVRADVSSPAIVAPAPEPDRAALLAERLDAAERAASAAEQRAGEAEERAGEAEQRAGHAERQATGMIASAQAANDALAQVTEAHAIAEEQARDTARALVSLTAELESLRRELQAEREERVRMEAALARLHAERSDRVRELRPATPAPKLAAVAPAPPALRPVAPAPSAVQPVAPVAPASTAPAPAVRAPSIPPAPAPGPHRAPAAARGGSSVKARGLRRMIAALRRS